MARPQLDHLPAPDEGLDLRDLFRAWWSARVPIAIVAIVAAALTFGATFVMPRAYRATAVILPPEESDLLSNMGFAQKALTKFPAFGILSDYFTPADVYKAILLSRTVQEEIVDKFDLRTVYRQKSMEKTLKVLHGQYKVKLNPDGTIALNVEDRDPKRAAAMANQFLESLDRYNVEKRNTQAHRTRVFLERRMQETSDALTASEAALRQYEETHHAVVPPTSGGGDTQAAADLMARKMMLEVRLGMLRSYLREDNEEVVQTRLELDQLNQRIGNLPALQTDLGRLMRDAKIQEQLYLLLTSELEQARIRESMDTPTVQVLDAAVPPERPSKPRRLVLTAAALLLGLVGAATWVAFRENEPSAAR
jgi:uncharacterized protein involved in exopolysaccharide biosynthesis